MCTVNCFHANDRSHFQAFKSIYFYLAFGRKKWVMRDSDCPTLPLRTVKSSQFVYTVYSVLPVHDSEFSTEII
jgi:hypothetical protein